MMTVRDLLEFALVESSELSARPDRDQVKLALIDAGHVIVHLYARAIKHSLSCCPFHKESSLSFAIDWDIEPEGAHQLKSFTRFSPSSRSFYQ